MNSATASPKVRRWFQFRLRTLLAAAAILALAMGLGPMLWQRYCVNQAIDTLVEDGIGPWGAATPTVRARKPLDVVASDYGRATAVLMRVVRDDPDSRHRVHAIQAMRAVHHYGGTAEIRRRHLGELVRMATDGRAPVAVERELAETIADWMNVGVDATERTLILARAEQVDGQLLCDWLRVLTEIGGREELEFVFQHVDTDDETILWAIFNSPLITCHWPGMLPHVERWLRNPAVAECQLLEHEILLCSTEGREILLQYVLAPTNPDKLRRIGFEQLQGNLAGVELLSEAAQTPKGLVELRKLAMGDPESAFEAKRNELRERLGGDLWNELIEDLERTYRSRSVAMPDPVVEKQQAEYQQEATEETLRCLRVLSGRNDITEPEAWRRWYEAATPPPMTRREFLQLCLDHPDLCGSTTVLSRIAPYELGYVPQDCLPVYRRLAKEGSGWACLFACGSLLYYTEDVVCVPLLFDAIDRDAPADWASSHSATIMMLKDRFGVNFFWDTDAWHRWWRKYQQKPVTRAIEGIQE